MDGSAEFLKAMGGEAGCRRLATEFYARAGNDSVLRPLFPGQTHKCAIKEFTAFLIQFLGGDEGQTQDRWWLSLRESHARIRIGAAERSAWLKQMRATLAVAPLDETARKALYQFFLQSSAYLTGKAAETEHKELAARWNGQLALDDAIGAIANGDDSAALSLAAQFAARPSVYAGLLARMIGSGRPVLLRFVINAAERQPSLIRSSFAGKTLLHFASGAGRVEVVRALLQLGLDPDIQDRGGHTPLYCAANECASKEGLEVVRMLAQAGADVNACAGVMRATALHVAARRGNVQMAGLLLDCGASLNAKDRKGDTPLQRALNCRKHLVAQLLVERAGATTSQKSC